MTHWPELLLLIYISAAWFLRKKCGKEIWGFWAFATAILIIGLEEWMIKSNLSSTSYQSGEARIKLLLLISGCAVSYILKAKNFDGQILTTISVLGSLAAISARDFWKLFFALELAAIPLYRELMRDKSPQQRMILIVLPPRLFYALLGSVFFMLATILIYFSTESTIFGEVRYIVSFNSGVVQEIAMLMILFSIGQKLGIGLQHFTLTDASLVKTSSPIVLCPLQTISAIVFYRLTTNIFCYIDGSWIISTVGLVFVLCGSFLLISQQNIRKIVACSILCHMGMIFLCSVSPFSHDGMQSILCIVVAWNTVILGIYRLQEWRSLQNLDDLQMASSQYPAFTMAVTILFLSLLGFAPFLGFWSRFNLCQALLGWSGGALTIYMISCLFNLIGLAKILDCIWSSKKQPPRNLQIDPEFVREIYFLALAAIVAIPLAYRVLNTENMEAYFVQ
ncbi:MAG: hypothetical protein LBS14_00990 [Holosporaceae bacterium]|jgi:formate hydrogenlyase subunit 3/multisubunit Na+/H+ antiporter MnhD subunit|nr:hypothetical protein [Holosporaceae bacterium]